MSIRLKEIREAAGATQKEVATGMGFVGNTRRGAVAKIEARSDWLKSTIAAYCGAVGATAELVIHVNGRELRFDVTGG